MKIIPEILLMILILISGCDNSPKIELVGNLGDDLKSRFQLNQDGDKFSGYFFYDNGISNRISVIGVRNGNTLRIEEFNNNENKLTGIFEGEFDGTTFKGHWKDPKKSKRVPFIYRNENNQRSKNEDTEEKKPTKKAEIKYLVKKQFGGEFHEILESVIGDKKYKITDFNDNGIFVRIVDVRDFDNNGYEDALIEETCGGTACPLSSLFFCIYDHKNDEFKITESFGSISESPKIEKWKGKWSVGITSGRVMEMYRAKERYILDNGEPVRVEYEEAKRLKAKLEMLPEDFSDYEKRSEKVIKYDLDGDGKYDSIIGEYWDRWNSINWKIKFANGKYFDGQAAYLRIGILPSKTNGVHDLVLGLDNIFIWTGDKYVKK